MSMATFDPNELASLLDLSNLEERVRNSDRNALLSSTCDRLAFVYRYYCVAGETAYDDREAADSVHVAKTASAPLAVPEPSRTSDKVAHNPDYQAERTCRDKESNKPRRKRKGERKVDGMMKLTQQQYIPIGLTVYLYSSYERDDPDKNYDPSDTTAAREFLKHIIDWSADLSDDPESNSPSVTFSTCCEYTVHLQDRILSDKVRWAFMMRFMYRVVRLINPAYSGRRFGHRMWKKFRKYSSLLFPDGETCSCHENVEKWSRMGFKITQLCEELGSGCIFVLARHLSEDFLLNKYRESGPVKDYVYESLKEQGIRKTADEAGATELGDEIDKYLFDGFEARFKQLSSSQSEV